MKRYEVIDPGDFRNPISVVERNGLLLVYHGSSSVYSSSIEKHGFDTAVLPYAIEDVRTINAVYETYGWVGLGGGYSVTRWFTAGNQNAYVDQKQFSFSYHYEQVRNYAVNPGGETVHHVLVAIDQFERFARELAVRRAHHESLNELILGTPSSIIAQTPYQARLEASKNDRRVSCDLQSLLTIRKKYAPIVARHRAVVYAVHGNRGHFDRLPRIGDFDFRATSPIPSDLIFARIDFPNGITRKQYNYSEFEEPPF